MAGEILASIDDINTHLPSDKALITDADDDQLQVDAARYVRSLLAGFFSPATLVSWNVPGNTPELIRGIAGRIIAAKWYANLYSEDIPGVSEFAQALYNEANGFIDRIRSGQMVVLDSNDNPIPIISGAIGISPENFLPNALTGDPKISIDMRFA